MHITLYLKDGENTLFAVFVLVRFVSSCLLQIWWVHTITLPDLLYIYPLLLVTLICIYVLGQGSQKARVITDFVQQNKTSFWAVIAAVLEYTKEKEMPLLKSRKHLLASSSFVEFCTYPPSAWL